MIDERELAINPIVQDSVRHNAQTLSNIRALTASLFGVGAGILGLESYPGFAFYLLGTFVVSSLIYLLRVAPESQSTGSKDGANLYFYRPMMDLWVGDSVGNMMGFVLTWTLFYGLVRA
ncbi:hypothetical protein NA57DRAFT_76395 [Rhizodiscina lignyota]|uniref:ER membrane protein complex subunit 6 n=1 Tax=Rhizodiscina lignyota TaxID=1504668 RepID=A0A9P4M6E2_9PEZI|nr:hypothetical protein NA57DRAFT_76395 [Rhizodiscina lignyota]